MDELSPYELERLANIERNQKLLLSLGIKHSLLHNEKKKPKQRSKSTQLPVVKRIQPIRTKSVEIIEINEQTQVHSPIRRMRQVNSTDAEKNILRCCPRHLVINDVSYGLCRPSHCDIANLHKTFPRDKTLKLVSIYKSYPSNGPKRAKMRKDITELFSNENLSLEECYQEIFAKYQNTKSTKKQKYTSKKRKLPQITIDCDNNHQENNDLVEVIDLTDDQPIVQFVPDESDQEYEVEKVVDKRIFKGKVEYRIRWRGYTSEDDTWEPVQNLTGCDLHVKYEQEQTRKKRKSC
jgi:hypothetical protein